MNWLICWMSRRALERSAPMTSSTSRRLPLKTCGLFDKGIAGGSHNATSLDLNAQTVLTPAQDPFADALGDLFEADAFTESNGLSFLDDSLGLKKVTAQVTAEQGLPEPVTPLIQEWEALAGLGTNQLGEDSLDAFINLDSFLNGDALLTEEDGNNYNTMTNNTAQLEPEVVELKPEFLNLMEFDLTADTNVPEAVPATSSVSSTSTSACTSKTKRALKRKAKKSSGSVKTSMFDIDEAPSPMSVVVNAAQSLDHDYTNKRQKLHNVLDTTAATIVQVDDIASVWSTDLLLSDSESCITSTSSTTDKQTIRRIKNNVASKRSREQRKQKFADMDREAEDLIDRNAELRAKIVELEKMAKDMKAALVAKMAGGK